MPTDFDSGLARNAADFVPPTPIEFLAHAADVYGDRLAIVYGPVRRNWRDAYECTRHLANALSLAGVGHGDTMAALLLNMPAMVEAHFGVPMVDGTLNALNIRLDAVNLVFMLRHGEVRVLLANTEFADLVRQTALEIPGLKVIAVNDALGPQAEPLGDTDYETFLASGDLHYAWQLPADEWDAIALNYTSGTTGDPKSVVYHHQGAAINAVSNILEWDLSKHPVYLWTLPMFHCNGWCFSWTIAARAGVNVCLRKFEPKLVFDLMRDKGVTHYCAAPIVYTMLVNAPPSRRKGLRGPVRGMVAGAPPPAAVSAQTEAMGFELTHVYGLTEVYGPAAVCAEQDKWRMLPEHGRATMKARQGVRYHLQSQVVVLNPETMQPVPADGETIGEIMFRGNICMKGYLKNEKVTCEAFADGWLHTGDLGVCIPDGYVKIKDRSKDIIVSGGEDISSVEVEDALYRHPAVLAAAVIAQSDAKWDETPCAFAELEDGTTATAEDLVAHCKTLLAGFKMPKAVFFGPLPKTSTGKIQRYELRRKVESTLAIDV